ncbi:GGDEF domain-containing protein [Actinoplanes sp. N902-109]|uniref:GGDEF domain-containing protein n=1 Tax=Actinoplanes sp. (strain N902-109) TaxID=649831 RepID=UPI0003293B54|nr:GGDEF domain-containing protein [Actinoplanes sp. N902-109]AGL20065.1 diguanylate cyclase [Actinoplanes sp. N902-109]
MSGTSLAETPQSPIRAAAVQVGALLEQAEEARLRGDYRAGTELARQAAALAASAGDPRAQAEALRSLGNQLIRLGDQEAAVTACREAVAVLETAGDIAAICEVLTVQAMPLNGLGMHEEALEALGRAHDLAQQLGDRDLLYWVHNRIGVVHGSMGNRNRSTEYLMKALTMAEGMDDEARFCILNNLGDNAVYQVPQLRAAGAEEAAGAALREALGYVDEALRLARAAKHPFRESICLDNYGMLRALDDDFDTADRMIEDSRAIAAIHGYRSLESGALQHQAQVRLMRGECAKAIEGLLAALDRAVEAGETPMAMEIHHELSQAYEMVGDFAAALRHYKTYHELERTAHNDVAAARARMAVHQFELDNARLEAELARVRSAELEAATLSWQRQASEDPLTGLPNRRHAEQRLPEMLGTGGPLCVAIGDVDLFKGVNDRFGHFVGDEVLRQIAAVLRDNVRDNDLVARLGGEEFIVGLDGVDAADARARCEVLRAQVAAYPWESLQPGLRVTISFGLAVVPGEGDLAAGLVLADQRLYEAKRAGRNRVQG